MNPAGGTAWKRHVFYLDGFDPKGAAHHHALFQAEALKQSSVNGMTIRVGTRHRDADGNSAWKIHAVAADDSRSETTYEFARWDDIVRRHWTRSRWRLFSDMLSAYAAMFSSGEISTVWKMTRKPLVGLAYPLVVLGGGLALGTGLGVGVASALILRDVNGFATLATGLALFMLAMWAVARVERRLNTTWLVRIFSFVNKHARCKIPELESRLDAMATRVAMKIHANDVDEILIVGFSVGSILGVSVLARALRETQGTAGEIAQPVISLLTLGHCIPLLGLWPQAANFRDELAEIARNPNVKWIDCSSPTDWGSFALIDPVDACKVTVSRDARHNPEMRSPRFHTMFPAAVYAKLRRNKRRMHMQYLMAGDLPSVYDYFAISAGAQTLGERFAHR